MTIIKVIRPYCHLLCPIAIVTLNDQIIVMIEIDD